MVKIISKIKVAVNRIIRCFVLNNFKGYITTIKLNRSVTVNNQKRIPLVNPKKKDALVRVKTSSEIANAFVLFLFVCNQTSIKVFFSN